MVLGAPLLQRLSAKRSCAKGGGDSSRRSFSSFHRRYLLLAVRGGMVSRQSDGGEEGRRFCMAKGDRNGYVGEASSFAWQRA